MFAVLTELTVRLVPLPESVRTVLCSFDTVEHAGEAVSRIIAAGLVPAALEMLDALTIHAVEEWLHLGLDTTAGAMLLIDVDGPDAATTAATERVLDVCRRAGALEVRSAENDEERATLWKARKSAFGAYGRLSAGFYVMDGVVPRSRIPEALRRIAALAREHDLRVANVFHAGDGNLHPCILFDEREPGATTRVLDAGGEIMRVCVDAGGSITGEHGVGVEKREYMDWIFTKGDMAAMQRLKAAFGAGERFNPCKAFPTHKGCGEVWRGPSTRALGPDAYV